MIFKLTAFFLLVLLTSCATQKVPAEVQLFAYSRSTIPANTERNGIMPVPQMPEEIVTYFIYLEQVDPGMRVKKLWINGISYEASFQRVDRPVTIESGSQGPDKQIDTVFRASSRPAYRVVPGQVIGGKKRQLANNNAVLLEIESGGKRILGLSKEFKKLSPIVFE